MSSSLPPLDPRPAREGLPLRHWFVIAAAFGALSIALGEVVFGGTSWVTLGGPLLAMAGYIAIGWRIARTAESVSQFADSVYYLGFLLTLTALVAALMGIGRSEDVWDVIRLFGVKLVTTLVGLGVRVFLTNFRPSVEDSVEVAEEMLSRAAVSLRHRFDQLAVDLTAQTGAINATLDGAAQQIDVTLSSVVTRIGTELSESVTASSRALRESLEYLRKETTRAVDDLRAVFSAAANAMTQTVGSGAGSLGTTLAGASERIGAASGDLADRLGAFSAPVDLLTAKLDAPIGALATQIESNGGRLAALGAAQTRCAEEASVLCAALAAMSARTAGLDGEWTRLEAHLGELGRVFDRAAAAGPPFEELGDQVRAHAADLQAIAASASDAFSRLEREIEVGRTKLHALEQECERRLAAPPAAEPELAAPPPESAAAHAPLGV